MVRSENSVARSVHRSIKVQYSTQRMAESTPAGWVKNGEAHRLLQVLGTVPHPHPYPLFQPHRQISVGYHMQRHRDFLLNDWISVLQRDRNIETMS